MTITEQIISNKVASAMDLASRVQLHMLAAAETGASAMCTARVTLLPSAILPYHKHTMSEAVTLLEGNATIEVEGRSYRLKPLDCIHIPAGTPHRTSNASDAAVAVLLVAFAAPTPARELVENHFHKQERSDSASTDPEHVARFSNRDSYDLAEGTEFCDLFAGRFGSVGICGGYGRFQPGACLPCHAHDYDESITIVEGEAVCEVAGKRYSLSGYDTAFVPQGRPHRFLNESQKPMAMIWIYAGSEPSRSIVDVKYCLGFLAWKHRESL